MAIDYSFETDDLTSDMEFELLLVKCSTQSEEHWLKNKK
jgi:hypothetical protein